MSKTNITYYVHLLNCYGIKTVEQVRSIANGMIFLRNDNHYNRKFMQTKILFFVLFPSIRIPIFVHFAYICLNVRCVKWTHNCIASLQISSCYFMVFTVLLNLNMRCSQWTNETNYSKLQFHIEIFEAYQIWVENKLYARIVTSVICISIFTKRWNNKISYMIFYWQRPLKILHQIITNEMHLDI